MKLRPRRPFEALPDGFTPKADDNSHLFHLFVAAPFQRKGLGHCLWSTAKAQARRVGNTGEFTVNASLNAVPAYEKFDFARTGEIQRMHGVSLQPMRLNPPA